MEDTVKLREIGSVIADDVSPSFDVFRFKALANEYVSPGSLVAAALKWVSHEKRLQVETFRVEESWSSG